MPNTTLTPIALVLDTATAVALTALADDGTEELFDLTPGVPCDRIVLVFDNLDPAQILAVSIAAGDYWFATEAMTFDVAAATKKFLVLTGAGYKDKDTDFIEITLTPNAAATVCAELGAVELPPVTLLTGL